MEQIDRLAQRQLIRHQMITRGMLTFCDQEDPKDKRAWAVFRLIQETWAQAIQVEGLRSVLASGVAASTTDHALQPIHATLHPSTAEFWSSTGSGEHTGECLLYAMHSHALVRFVRLAFYRAIYQHGHPVYPSLGVSFYVGPSPTQLYLASPVYPAEPSDRVQVFALSCAAPAGSYLAVRFHEKCQRQLEDSQYYIAVRHVSALGTALPAHTLPHLQRALRASNLQWPASGRRQRAPAAAPPAAAAQQGATSGAAEDAHAAAGRHTAFELMEECVLEDVGDEWSAMLSVFNDEWAGMMGLFTGEHERLGMCPVAGPTHSTTTSGTHGQGLSAASLLRALRHQPACARAHSSSRGAGARAAARVGGAGRRDAAGGPRTPLLSEGAAARAAAGTSSRPQRDATVPLVRGEACSSKGGVELGGGRGSGSGGVGDLQGLAGEQDTAGAAAAGAEHTIGVQGGEQAASSTSRADSEPLVANLIHWLITRMHAAHTEGATEQLAQQENMEYLTALAERLVEGGGEGQGLPAGPLPVQQLLHIQSDMHAGEEEQHMQAAAGQEREGDDHPMEEAMILSTPSAPAAEGSDLRTGTAMAGVEHKSSLQGWPLSTQEYAADPCSSQSVNKSCSTSVTTGLLAHCSCKHTKLGAQVADQESGARSTLFVATQLPWDAWPVSDYDLK